MQTCKGSFFPFATRSLSLFALPFFPVVLKIDSRLVLFTWIFFLNIYYIPPWWISTHIVLDMTRWRGVVPNASACMRAYVCVCERQREWVRNGQVKGFLHAHTTHLNDCCLFCTLMPSHVRLFSRYENEQNWIWLVLLFLFSASAQCSDYTSCFISSIMCTHTGDLTMCTLDAVHLLTVATWMVVHKTKNGILIYIYKRVISLREILK